MSRWQAQFSVLHGQSKREMGKPMRLLHHISVSELAGVGPKRTSELRNLGIHTVRDLLFFFPSRYEAYTAPRPIHSVASGEMVTLQGKVKQPAQTRFIGENRSRTQVTLADRSGEITAIWFNQAFRGRIMVRDQDLWVRGKVDIFRQSKQIVVQECGAGKAPMPGLKAFYPLKQLIGQGHYRTLVKQAVELLIQNSIEDRFAAELCSRFGILSLSDAIQFMHHPQGFPDIDKARRRFAFEEAWATRVASFLHDDSGSGLGSARVCSKDILDCWRASLPYSLTQAQERCIAEIETELYRELPMRRLLQGDVGSGKTAVAAAAALYVVSAGYQVAFLAPTDILAKQHCASLAKLLPAQLPLHLLTASVSSETRKSAIEAGQNGDAGLWIGTHALLSERMKLAHLGLVIVDEQHRFGVRQRQKLLEGRSSIPDLLCLSATPIPRTLQLAMYGDMAMSTLDEYPAGRLEIKTTWIQNKQRWQPFISFCQQEIAAGNKMYWVCPSIDGEDSGLASLTQRLPFLQRHLKTHVSVVHGQAREADKDSAMQGFLNGESSVLLATTVVEVGLDHPRATIMVIENAERFGLAQLHQLRGRVGRSDIPSYCVLIAGTVEQLLEDQQPDLTDVATKRLHTLVSRSDGFALAALDLELRGPGEVLGTVQSGFTASPLGQELLSEEDLGNIDAYITTLDSVALAAEWIRSQEIVEDTIHAD